MPPKNIRILLINPYRHVSGLQCFPRRVGTGYKYRSAGQTLFTSRILSFTYNIFMHNIFMHYERIRISKPSRRADQLMSHLNFLITYNVDSGSEFV